MESEPVSQIVISDRSGASTERERYQANGATFAVRSPELNERCERIMVDRRIHHDEKGGGRDSSP